MRRSLPFALKRSWRRLRFRWRRDQFYRELSEEMELHYALKRGETAEGAVDLSGKEMGNITLAKEECRDMWSFVGWERIWQDLRYAGRMFRRTPVFTGIAVASLALGIGGNAAMFSLVDTLLVRPLPYAAPERLVRITGVYPRSAVRFFEQQSRTMDVAAVGTGSEWNLTGQGMATRVEVSGVSANFLDVLGSAVGQGRGFQAGEDLPGRDRVVILSHALWKTRFVSDPAIVGRMVTLNGVQREVVGVMPKGFSYPSANIQAWAPMRLDPANFLEYWGGEFVPLIARLRPGASWVLRKVKWRTWWGGLERRFRTRWRAIGMRTRA